MQFSVTIRKPGVADEVRAMDLPNRFAVYEAIEKENGLVVGLEETSGSYKIILPHWFDTILEGRVKKIEIAHMARNLSTMLSAGLSLSRALSVIERESENKRLKAIAVKLASIVEKGSPFHAALAEYPQVFPNILIAMVRVGEESGSLADALTTVGLQMERSDELTRKIKGALIYPCIIIVAIMIVSILMMLYVVPTLTSTFTELKVELPLATRVFVAISNFMVAHVFLVLAGLAGFVLGGLAFVRSRRGKTVVLTVSLHLPVIRELVRETYAARTSRTISSLLSAGVPVLEALSITREVIQEHFFGSVIEEAETRVKKGEALSLAFAEHEKVYPILMSEMLSVGEETGKVTDMLKQAAEFYEQDVSQRTKDLSTIIEPVLMLLIGAVVGVFAVSMIAPIYSLSSAI